MPHMPCQGEDLQHSGPLQEQAPHSSLGADLLEQHPRPLVLYCSLTKALALQRCAADPLKLHVVAQLLLLLLLDLQGGDALVELVHGWALLDGLWRRRLGLAFAALRSRGLPVKLQTGSGVKFLFHRLTAGVLAQAQGATCVAHPARQVCCFPGLTLISAFLSFFGLGGIAGAQTVPYCRSRPRLSAHLYTHTRRLSLRETMANCRSCQALDGAGAVLEGAEPLSKRSGTQVRSAVCGKNVRSKWLSEAELCCHQFGPPCNCHSVPASP